MPIFAKYQKAISQPQARKKKSGIREFFESIAFALLVALLIRSFVFEAFKIPSGSMIPTLAIGDRIFVNKFIYNLRVPLTTIRLLQFKKPQRGDVVVFVCPVPPYDDYIKRIIGLPGDVISVRNGLVFINDKPIPRIPLGDVVEWDKDNSRSGHATWHEFKAKAYQEVLDGHTYTVLQEAETRRNAPDFGPYKVPEDHVLMMGDNRDHSYDSRAWGPVPIQNILGRSMFVFWSFGKNGVNPRRVGTFIE